MNKHQFQKYIHQKLDSGSKLFFSSDFHFQHKNLCLGCSLWENKSGCRPFNSIQEHDSIILDNINDTVGENDVLFHLGDFAFGKKENIPELRKKINCKSIISCRGNHDVSIDNYYKNLFDDFQDRYSFYIGKQYLICDHYALQVWENNHNGAIMLHAHSHNNIDHKDDGKILDVCLEGHKYRPWSYDEIVSYMDSKPIVARDHHK